MANRRIVPYNRNLYSPIYLTNKNCTRFRSSYSVNERCFQTSMNRNIIVASTKKRLYHGSYGSLRLYSMNENTGFSVSV